VAVRRSSIASSCLNAGSTSSIIWTRKTALHAKALARNAKTNDDQVRIVESVARIPVQESRPEMRVRRVASDAHLENVGQNTLKRLPTVSWRSLANTDAPGKTILAVFVGTLILFTLLFCVAHMVRT